MERGKESERKGMKESTDKSATANESSSVTDRRSDANLEASELQVKTTRHENLIPAGTKFKSWGVKMLWVQGREGMRAGQRHGGCGGSKQGGKWWGMRWGEV